MASQVLTLVLVGANDHPIYEADLASRGGGEPREDRLAHNGLYLHQFVMHAALDAVEEQQWHSSSLHLGVVDKFNNLQVSAYVTAAQLKFLLLHDGRNDDSIRSFFRDLYEVYLKLMLNPFFSPSAKIRNPAFSQKVRALAQRHFRL